VEQTAPPTGECTGERCRKKGKRGGSVGGEKTRSTRVRARRNKVAWDVYRVRRNKRWQVDPRKGGQRRVGTLAGESLSHGPWDAGGNKLGCRGSRWAGTWGQGVGVGPGGR